LLLYAVLLFGVYLVGTWHFAELEWLLFPGLGLLLVAVGWLTKRETLLQKRMLRDLTPEERADVLDATGLDGVLLDAYIDREHKDWIFIVTSGVAALIVIPTPPLLYTAYLGEISWDAPFTGVHLLLLFVGVASYSAGAWWTSRSYNCPRCFRTAQALGKKRARYLCRRCQIMWNLGA